MANIMSIINDLREKNIKIFAYFWCKEKREYVFYGYLGKNTLEPIKIKSASTKDGAEALEIREKIEKTLTPSSQTYYTNKGLLENYRGVFSWQ